MAWRMDFIIISLPNLVRFFAKSQISYLAIEAGVDKCDIVFENEQKEFLGKSHNHPVEPC